MIVSLECNQHEISLKGLQKPALTAMVKTRSINTIEKPYNYGSVRFEKLKNPSHLSQAFAKSAFGKVGRTHWNDQRTRTRARQGFQSFGSLCLSPRIKLHCGNSCSRFATYRTADRCDFKRWQTSEARKRGDNSGCNAPRFEGISNQKKTPAMATGSCVFLQEWYLQVTRPSRVWSSVFNTCLFPVCLEVAL
jgi:hypothetical protein